MDVLCEIQKYYNEFSGKEKDIADYIINQKEMINNISISNLANKIGTSSSTITRFSKKIGCESFVDLKIKLSNIKSNNNKDEDSILTHVYNYYTEAVERNKSIINQKKIDSAVAAIKKAKKIYIYGVGSSGLSSIEMMQRLLRMGFNVNTITDSHMMIISSAIASKGDLVIGISIGGETEAVNKALKISKENGADIIAITSFEKSTITTFADLVLLVYNLAFVDVDRFINTQFSTMYLLDLICISLLRDKKLRDKMGKTIEAIRGNQ